MNRYATAAIAIGAWAATVCASCADHNHNHTGHADAHGAEAHAGHSHNETLQLTAYAAGIEVYAEAQPLVAGHASHVLAHLSTTADFAPMDGATLKARLTIGGREAATATAEASAPGIYTLSLTPDATGHGSLELRIEHPKASGTVTLPRIEVFDTEHKAHHAAAAQAAESEGCISFSKEQSWRVDFATDSVRRAPMGQVIATQAMVMPAPTDMLTLTAKASGTVTLGPSLAEGVDIGAGETLMTISGGNSATDDMLVLFSQAQADYERARADHERCEALAADRIVTQAELQQARADYAKAKAAYDNLLRNGLCGRAQVASSVAGYVRQLLVTNGQHVETGQPLAQVARGGSLWLQALVPARHAPMLRHLASAHFGGAHGTLTLADIGGRVVSAGQHGTSGSPLLAVTFATDSTRLFVPGTMVDTYVVLQQARPVLSVPNGAIAEEMGSRFVFVQRTPELFEKREIECGITDGLRTQVTRGLEAGERIVTRGAIMVKLAQGAAALDAHSGHAH